MPKLFLSSLTVFADVAKLRIHPLDANTLIYGNENTFIPHGFHVWCEILEHFDDDINLI